MSERSKEEMLKIIQSHAEVVQKIQKAYKEEILKLQKEKEELRNEVIKLKAILPKEDNPALFRHPNIGDIEKSKNFYLTNLKNNKLTDIFEEFVKSFYLSRKGISYDNKSNKITIQNKHMDIDTFFKLLYETHFKNLIVQFAKKENINIQELIKHIQLSQGLCKEILNRKLLLICYT